MDRKNYYDAKNNLKKVMVIDQQEEGELFNFIHDDKKNPFKNIVGLNRLIFKGFFATDLEERIILEYGENNIKEFSWAQHPYQTFNYTYNDEGYPVSATIGGTEVTYYY